MKRNKVKNILLIVLTIGFVTMIVAYATFTSQLLIRDNEAKVSGQTWDIHFENGQPVRTIGGATVRQEPTLTATVISGLRVDFVSQGDGIVYDFYIKNAGTLNAALQSIMKGTPECISTNTIDANNVCSNIEYKLIYTETGEEVSIGDKLDAGQSVRVSLIVNYKNITPTVLTSDVTIKGFEAVFNYVQY